MKKLFIGLLLLALVACQSKTPEVLPELSEEPTISETTVSETPSESVKPLFTLRSASEEFIQKTKAHTISEKESASAMELVAEADLKEVTLWTLSDGEYTNTGLKVKGTTFGESFEMKKGESILVYADTEDMMPSAGVSYVDSEGNVQSFGFFSDPETGAVTLSQIMSIAH